MSILSGADKFSWLDINTNIGSWIIQETGGKLLNGYGNTERPRIYQFPEHFATYAYSFAYLVLNVLYWMICAMSIYFRLF